MNKENETGSLSVLQRKSPRLGVRVVASCCLSHCLGNLNPMMVPILQEEVSSALSIASAPGRCKNTC
jgi:hypothetical protein